MLSLFSPTTVELIDVRQVARLQDVVPLYLVEQGAVTQLLASMLLSACVVASQRWLVSVIAGGMTFSSGKCCRLIFRGVGIRPSHALGLGNDRVVVRRRGGAASTVARAATPRRPTATTGAMVSVDSVVEDDPCSLRPVLQERLKE